MDRSGIGSYQKLRFDSEFAIFGIPDAMKKAGRFMQLSSVIIFGIAFALIMRRFPGPPDLGFFLIWVGLVDLGLGSLIAAVHARLELDFTRKVYGWQTKILSRKTTTVTGNFSDFASISVMIYEQRGEDSVTRYPAVKLTWKDASRRDIVLLLSKRPLKPDQYQVDQLEFDPQVLANQLGLQLERSAQAA